MKIILVVPSFNGHFLNYIDIIKSAINESQLKVFKSSETTKIYKFYYHNKVKKIIFLHGDKDFLVSLFLKCLLPSLNISLVIYYTFNNRSSNIKNSLKKYLLKSLSYLNIELLLLEGDYLKLKHINNKKVKIIPDPLTLNNKVVGIKVSQKETINYLVAGYLDDRKSIPSLIQTLITLSKKDLKKRAITLLGVQSESVNHYLTSLDENDYIKTKIKNYRYDDSELEIELQKCDCVWAIYLDHFGSSGMVINAIHFNKPVIFLDTGVLAHFANELKITGLPKNNNSFEIEIYLSNLEEKSQFSSESRTKFLNKRDKTNFINKILN